MADGVQFLWEGVQSISDAFDRYQAQADTAVREIVAKSAALVEAAAKANFEGSHKAGQPHVGGDKPNVVTGSLRRSIRTDPIVKTGRGEYSTSVAPRVAYARRVELGYRGSKGYPYFEPAVHQVQPALEALAVEAWRRVVT